MLLYDGKHHTYDTLKGHDATQKTLGCVENSLGITRLGDSVQIGSYNIYTWGVTCNICRSTHTGLPRIDIWDVVGCEPRFVSTIGICERCKFKPYMPNVPVHTLPVAIYDPVYKTTFVSVGGRFESALTVYAYSGGGVEPSTNSHFQDRSLAKTVIEGTLYNTECVRSSPGGALFIISCDKVTDYVNITRINAPVPVTTRVSPYLKGGMIIAKGNFARDDNTVCIRTNIRNRISAFGFDLRVDGGPQFRALPNVREVTACAFATENIVVWTMKLSMPNGRPPTYHEFAYDIRSTTVCYGARAQPCDGGVV